MTAPTLPGTIPGLLRRGSPIVATDGFYADDSGVLVSRHYHSSMVHLRAFLVPIPHDCIALDLTDATGRAHAAWWLAGRAGVSWSLDCDGHRRWVLHGGEAPREGFHRAFEGIGSEVRHMRLRSHPPEYGWDAEDVPALDHLDPDDDTRLPDGSRWVDAEALRLVCLHVAGGAS